MTVAGPHAYLSRTAIAMLALAAGVAIANGYALQPSLSAIAGDFGVSAARMATLASVTMLGYLAGLALLVPLVDRFGPRTLVSAQMGVLAALLACASLSSTPFALDVCFLLVGAATTVAAQCSAVVGKHAEPQRRGGAMGVVSAGISAGILLSRFVGGALSQWYGWRGALLALAGCVALAAVGSGVLLPGGRPEGRSGHAATIGAIPRLLRDSAALRRRTCAGMLWFFAFNLVWVGLAIRLAAPPYGMGAAEIGAYSLAGVLGLGVTRVAGKLTDRFGDRAVIGGGLAVAALSALLLGVALGHPGWLGVGLAVFDAGCFAAQVANQARVVAIQPVRAGALNAAYLTLYYAAGAGGAVAAGMLVERLGWGAMMLVAAGAVTAAAWIGASRATVGAAGEPMSAG
ncbi:MULTISPECIES: MFS transporter [Burkholderia cepacia complex]|uniref:MFS transporter n=1 Tax=Burkholderia cepacia complex TaxID=87882 RepID=UPI00098249D1|nr:MFS transporter [Burkholderia cenocepacia]AQQ28334.1 MFS transporter [Burkholderia cenocepacia]ONV87503.1 MFS transporter [Burkholderia cenocepacia]ONV96012.1 MFS transporter [Burkholderia cenocepacia]ONW13821.1 MFS transporter [Burkholderia cenocepacia]ONW18749.1 MFS transporter [Burkholderia cenocepacia]